MESGMRNESKRKSKSKSKSKVKGKAKIRTGTVSYLTRRSRSQFAKKFLTVPEQMVPLIRLSGLWLKNLGFEIGKKFVIQSDHSQVSLVLTDFYYANASKNTENKQGKPTSVYMVKDSSMTLTKARIKFIWRNKKYLHKILDTTVGTWFVEIPGFEGVWANGDTVENCRMELIEVLEEWLILNLAPLRSAIDWNDGKLVKKNIIMLKKRTFWIIMALWIEEMLIEVSKNFACGTTRYLFTWWPVRFYSNFPLNSRK